MKNYLISEDLGNKVLAYLGTKPYLEVAELVVGMQALVKAEPAADPWVSGIQPGPRLPDRPGTEGQSTPVDVPAPEPATPEVPATPETPVADVPPVVDTPVAPEPEVPATPEPEVPVSATAN